MLQASFKCETPRLELKSWQTFLAIKRCQRTENSKSYKASMKLGKKVIADMQPQRLSC